MATNNAMNNRWHDDIYLPPAIKDLSSSDILNMSVTPIDIIPTPGANKIIIVDEWLVELFFNSIQYTVGGTLQLIYTTSGIATGNPTMLANVITAADSSTILSSIQSGSNILSSNMANNGISIKNNTAPFLLGNSTARVYVWYSIIDAV